MSEYEEPSQHRLFAAIVLMGTGLAVGCGGIAERDRQASSDGSPGTSAAGHSSTGATSGGSSAVSTAGGPTIDIGGTGLGDPAVEPAIDPASLGPADCPSQQWACTTNECYSAGSWLLPTDCRCDLSRPRGAADCGQGLVFVCRRAELDAHTRVLRRPVDYDCVCAPKNEDGCQAECQDAYARGNLTCAPTEDELGISCGCAVIYLK